MFLKIFYIRGFFSTCKYSYLATNVTLDMSRRSSRIANKDQPNYNEKEISLNTVLLSKRKKAPIKKEKITLKSKPAKKEVKIEISDSPDYHTKKVKTEGVLITSSEPLCNAISDNSKMIIGCHTSISGGIWKAPEEASQFGAKAFGLFTHNQQQWKMKPLVEGHVKRFQETCKIYGYAPNHIVPHGSYLMNCGSAKDDVRQKSGEMLLEELKRCEELGLIYFNFHPGSTLGKIPVETCLSYIAEAINNAHRKTKYVITLLENMSCQGNTVGGKFQELRDIIEMVNKKDRMGVCIDTCHAHAAGYDLSTSDGYEVFVEDLESIIGLKYVKAFHLNDSKGPSGCHKDRHENIGKGTIGLRGFERVMNDSRFEGIPMILETPFINDHIYKKEIELLYSL